MFYKSRLSKLNERVGRLREIAFRHYGGGTGLEADIDPYDVMKVPYRQLITFGIPKRGDSWRISAFIYGSDVEFDEHGKPRLATAHLLSFHRSF